jgi:F-type H+-transporting ATPase subunit b
MRAVHIRRLLGAGALVAAFGLATLAPAGAQEEAEGEESTELDHAVEECIHELEEANSIDVNCQQAPNPLVPEKNEVIWGTFGFLIVFAFLAWKGIPAIRNTMDARTERIRGDLEGAESAKAEAQSVLDEYRAQLADAKAEAGRIIEEARSAADGVRRDQEARLQTELAGMRERAAADVEAAKAQAIADLRGEVATLAIGAAEVVVGRNLDHDTQAQLVEQYIASVQNRN